MSLKNRDNHNRWRNKTVAFRVSPEEDAQIETFVKLSGLTKHAHVSSLIRFFASLILLSSINSHLVPPSPGTFWDFVELCGYCNTFQGICIAVGLVGGYERKPFQAS